MKLRLCVLLVLALGLLWLADSRAEIKITGQPGPAQTDPEDQPHADPTDPADQPHDTPTDPEAEPYSTPTDPADEPHPDRTFEAIPQQQTDVPASDDSRGPLPTAAARKKPAGGSSGIMTAEQGEELSRKLEEYDKGQQKLLEKFDELEKDYVFLKAQMRRPRSHP